jgi:hypothetical protein
VDAQWVTAVIATGSVVVGGGIAAGTTALSDRRRLRAEDRRQWDQQLNTHFHAMLRNVLRFEMYERKPVEPGREDGRAAKIRDALEAINETAAGMTTISDRATRDQVRATVQLVVTVAERLNHDDAYISHTDSEALRASTRELTQCVRYRLRIDREPLHVRARRPFGRLRNRHKAIDGFIS